MAQWLRTFVALAENTGTWFLVPHHGSRPYANSSSTDPTPSSSLYGTRHAHGAHMYIHAKNSNA